MEVERGGVGARRCGRAFSLRVLPHLSNAHSLVADTLARFPHAHASRRLSLFPPPPPLAVYQLSPSDTLSINSHYICLLGASRIRKHGSDRLRLLELDRNPPHNPESAWLDCTAPHYCESTRHTNAGLALLVAPSPSTTTTTILLRALHIPHPRCPATQFFRMLDHRYQST